MSIVSSESLQSELLRSLNQIWDIAQDTAWWRSRYNLASIRRGQMRCYICISRWLIEIEEDVDAHSSVGSYHTHREHVLCTLVCFYTHSDFYAHLAPPAVLSGI